MATHVARLAVAEVVVDELHAVLRARAATRVGQALVDVPLAAWADEAGRALAFEATHFVDTGAVIVASAREAVVHVDLTDDAQGPCRTIKL